MNLLRAATLPVILYTSFVLLRNYMSISACIFFWIGFYASLVDHESEKFSEGHAKCALE